MGRVAWGWGTGRLAGAVPSTYPPAMRAKPPSGPATRRGPVARRYGDPVLSPTVATVRLALHVLAATVWVGGQVALAGVLGTLRGAAPDAVRPVARAFARIAWPAYVVLVATGIWNLVAVDVTATGAAYQLTLAVKLLAAVAAGAAAAVHSVGRGRAALAAGGAVALLASIAALALGVLLRSGSG